MISQESEIIKINNN